jgi:hypothetical protein
MCNRSKDQRALDAQLRIGEMTTESFTLLENAQYDRADEGKRDIGCHNAHAAGESHAKTP